MNKFGELYLQKINKMVSEYNKLDKDAIPKYSWSDSIVQERIMRLGREARAFDIKAHDTKELEMIAIATLKKDFISKTL